MMVMFMSDREMKLKDEIVVSTKYVLDMIKRCENGDATGLAMQQVLYEILVVANHDPRNYLGDDNV